jgi:hypothetical protein
MDAVALLLTTAFRHLISEPNIEAGYERFAALTGGSIDELAFRNAVMACLCDQLIYEPIRLSERALQCHWRLELTPKGAGLAQGCH